MASINMNHLVDDVTGGFGRIVLRRRFGKVFLARRAKGIEPHPSQLAQRQRFRETSAYSKLIFDHPVRRTSYETAAAAQGKSVFTAILTDFLRKPVIGAVDTDGYHGVVGDLIVVHPRVDLPIAEVQVKLLRGDTQVPIESGNAVRAGDVFRYTATQAVPAGTAVLAEVTVRDTDGLAVTRPLELVVVSRFPVVETIDVGGYHGQVGNPIVVRASDDVGVTGVTVLLRDAGGNDLENIVAVRVGDTWRAIATVAVPLGSTVVVVVTATDAAGNNTERELGLVVA